MKASMPASTAAQLESDAHAARRQGADTAQASSVLVDRRASAGSSRALQAKLQDSQQSVQLRALQAKMAGPQAAAQLASLDEEEPLQGKFETAQRASLDEEEPLQGKFETAQLASLDEEEPLQGKFETAQRASLDEEEPLQGKFETAQLASLDEEEPLQGKFDTAQLASLDEEEPLQAKSDGPAKAEAGPKNNTGMPDQLKSGIESLSGMAMDHVKVHYNSSKPAALQAHAYAQGSDIHVGPGQEKHLPHEAWHVVQQGQGRVQPTTQMAGVQVNDDTGLEREADVMGEKALNQS